MKLIDVLVKIANGEELKAKLKFTLGDIIITFYGMNNYYHTPEYKIEYIDKGCDYHDFTLGMLIKCLNDEVEIIEEDKKIENKIEKLDCDIDHDDNVSINGKCIYDNALLEIGNKINEIIDYLNKENK